MGLSLAELRALIKLLKGEGVRVYKAPDVEIEFDIEAVNVPRNKPKIVFDSEQEVQQRAQRKHKAEEVGLHVDDPLLDYV